jgi:hypothetical protein
MIIMSGMSVNPVLMRGGKRKITEDIVSLSGGAAKSKTGIGPGATVIPIATSGTPDPSRFLGARHSKVRSDHLTAQARGENIQFAGFLLVSVIT